MNSSSGSGAAGGTEGGKQVMQLPWAAERLL